MSRAVRCAARVIAASLLAAMLAACGGGSDEGGGSATPRPPPEPVTAPLLLTESNASDAVLAALAGADTVLEFVELGAWLVDTFWGLDASAAVDEALDCFEGGAGTLRVTDRNRNGFGGGDRVEFRFNRCANDGLTLTGVLGTTAHGRVGVPGSGGSGFRTSYTVDIGELVQSTAGLSSVLNAVIRAEHERSGESSLYTVTSSWFSFEVDGRVESLTDVELSLRRGPGEHAVWFALSMAVHSDALGGRFTVSTERELRGAGIGVLDEGELVLTGANGGAVRFVAGAASQPGLFRVGVLSSEGTTANGAWTRDWIVDPNDWPFDTDGGGPAVPLPQPPPLVPLVGSTIALGGEARAIEVDAKRDRIYVTIPERNEVVVISASALSVEERIVTGSAPGPMDLSADGDTLYVGNVTGGSVSVLDLVNGGVSTHHIGLQLSSSTVRDVIEIAPGIVLVAAGRHDRPGHVVRLDTRTGEALRVADELEFYSGVQLHAGADSRYAYGVGFLTTGGLYQLDRLAPEVPIVRHVAHASHSHGMAISPNGSRLIETNGHVRDAVTLESIAWLPHSGLPRYSNDSRLLALMSTSFELRVFDAESHWQLEHWEVDCGPFANRPDYRHLSSGRWAVLVGASLCVLDTRTPDQPPSTGTQPTPPETPVFDVAGESLILDGTVAALAVDAAAGVAYLSMPGRDQVAVVSLDGMSLLAQIPVSGQPLGLSLSADAATLSVALGATGEVAWVDTATRTVTGRVDVAAALGSQKAHDVLEATPGRVFVAADAASSPQSHIVQVMRDQGNAVQRAGEGLEIGSDPRLAVSPDGTTVYASSNHPAQMAALDLRHPDAPVLRTSLENELPIRVNGIGPPAPRAGGQHVFLSNGHRLRADTLTVDGVLPAGPLAMSEDGAYVMVAGYNPVLYRYGADSLVLEAEYRTGCEMNMVRHLVAVSPSRWLLAQGWTVCAVTLPPPE